MRRCVSHSLSVRTSARHRNVPANRNVGNLFYRRSLVDAYPMSRRKRRERERWRNDDQMGRKCLLLPQITDRFVHQWYSSSFWNWLYEVEQSVEILRWSSDVTPRRKIRFDGRERGRWAALNWFGEFAVFVQIVQIEDPAEFFFDRSVNENRKAEEQIFEPYVTGVWSIDVLKNK